MTSTRTRVPSLGVAVHARSWGGAGSSARPPVVLLHGLGLSSSNLAPLGRRLAALGHRVLAPDLPGFGRTPESPPGRVGRGGPGGPGVGEQADQVLAWLEACDLGPVVLFGNSVGAQVAVDLAVRHPERVERLVLEGPSPDPRSRTPWREHLSGLANWPFEAPTYNPLRQVEYARAGLPRTVRQLRHTVGDPLETRLPGVRVPTLVVRGRHDAIVSQQWAEQVAALLPDGRLVVVEGAAHNVHYTAPHVAARLVDAFLGGGLDDAAAGREVVPGPEQEDPLRPGAPVPAGLHGVVDHTAAALCLTVPRLLGFGPRATAAFAAAGAGAALYSLLTDYPAGVVRVIPMPVHLNLDAASGLLLLLGSATLLRGERGRWAAAAFGAFEVLAAVTTRIPVGPARLVTLPHGE